MIPAFPKSTVLTNITAKAFIPNATKKTHKPTSPANSNLKSLAKSGKLEDALSLIESRAGGPDAASAATAEAYSLLLHACISRRSLEHGQRLYLHLLKANRSLLNDPSVKSKLITLFSVCGRVDDACSVFRYGLDNGHVPESVWVAMAIGYSRNGFSEQALLHYSDMLSRFVKPGNFAFSTALKASADLLDMRAGRAVHAQIIKSDEEPDQVVNNALLGMYAQCGFPDDALKMFEKMPQRNVVSWNSLISDFVRRDQVFDALDAFRMMQGDGIEISWVTLTTILAVCARATALKSGKEIHARIIKSARRPDIPALNSLLDMYAKCGEIDYCRRVFDEMQSKDSTSWNTMLTGYAMNGFIEEAIELFDEMVDSVAVKPDGVTFIALLSGCSHAGLIDEGWRLFNDMESVYGVSPTIEHYACLVDLLGRAGYIKEALEVVETMPMRPGSSIWGSLLNSCRLHGSMSLGELVADELFELEPNNPGNYVMLSNIYANAGMWDSVKRVREMMEERGIKKDAGCSWMQIRNRIHTFVAGGSFEFRNSTEFEKVWSELSKALEDNGYTPNTSVVLHDVNKEKKASWVCGHSERLATTFALINTSDGVPIRITKNLRVCTDCHSWMKHVSQITKRIIVLRDTNRFHHFKEGKCSCKDYW